MKLGPNVRGVQEMLDPNGDTDPAADTHTVLETTDLKKHFQDGRRQVRVLEGIDLAVSAGEIVLVTGRSGAGKTTLISLMAGLDRPSCGSVMIDGRALENLSNQELTLLRRRKIGIVFQSFNLLPSLTAAENVEAALLPTLMPKAERREKVKSLLEGLGLGDRADRLPPQLSVGEQQRVAVARALVNNPVLILADEPTGDVDDETAAEIVDLLVAPVRQANAALVVTTHGCFPGNAAGRALRLKDGKLSPQAHSPGS